MKRRNRAVLYLMVLSLVVLFITVDAPDAQAYYTYLHDFPIEDKKIGFYFDREVTFLKADSAYVICAGFTGVKAAIVSLCAEDKMNIDYPPDFTLLFRVDVKGKRIMLFQFKKYGDNGEEISSYSEKSNWTEVEPISPLYKLIEAGEWAHKTGGFVPKGGR